MSLGGALRGVPVYSSVTSERDCTRLVCVGRLYPPRSLGSGITSEEDGSTASHMTNPFDSLLDNYLLGNYIKIAASDVSSRERAELWVYRDIIV